MWRLWQQVDPYRFVAVLGIFLAAVALLIHFLLFQSERFNWLDGPRAVEAAASAPADPAPAALPVAKAPPADPAGPPAPSEPGPAAVEAETGGWQVQLGAYGDPANADARWEEVKARFAGKAPTFEKRDALTRLLVRGFGSQADARAACGDLTECEPLAR